MILEEGQVLELASDSIPDEWIEDARKEADLLRMHYYGVGLTKYLTKIQGLENDTQIALRKKYAISNESMISSLLRAVDNAWSAKGGIVSIEAPESVKIDLTEKILQASNKKPVKDYLRNEWFDRFVSDPNGLLFVEASVDGENAYPVYKSIYDINKMYVKGTQPEYIVFEPHKIEEEKSVIPTDKKTGKTYKWVVDDANYYLVVGEGEGAYIKEIIPNPFGIVPAIQNSPIVNTLNGLKASVLHKQLMLLDAYLIDNSVNNIYKKLHGFPVFWFYAGKCDACKGKGEIEGETCKSCNGTGQSMKRDVSDGIPLRTPKNSDSPTIAPNVAGYVQPALETWQEQRIEIQDMWDRIYFSHWGTTVEKSPNETATGRFIDAQPVINRLHQYSDVFEYVNKRLLELLAKFYYPNTDIQISVSYGRRYLVETPDQIWKKYLESRKEGADTTSLDLLLSQYYESEFQSDEMLKEYHLKLMRVEPLVHYTVDTVVGMDVSRKLKNMKVYFQDWKNTTTIMEVNESEIETLIDNLKQYSNEQVQESQTGEDQGGTPSNEDA